jgi:hypothetical protein
LNATTYQGPTPRPIEYSPRDFYNLTKAAHKLEIIGELYYNNLTLEFASFEFKKQHN